MRPHTLLMLGELSAHPGFNFSNLFILMNSLAMIANFVPNNFAHSVCKFAPDSKYFNIPRSDLVADSAILNRML